MSDLISRRAAIAKVNEYASIWMEYTEGMSKDEIAQAALNSAKQTMIRILSELPSAQPEIIRCRDCRYWGAYPSSSAMPWLHECYARIARLHTAADEFCSRAERREVSE